MSDLTNNLINSTYKKLLQVSTSGNTGISGTLTNVQTGDGTNTAVKLATSAVQVDGTLFVGQTFGVSGDASVAGNLAISNKVCASAFHGDGSNLTGLVFTGDVSVSSLIVTNNVTVGGNVTIGGNVMVSGGEIQVKNTGSQSNIKLYCESSNAHYAALQAPPHSSFSGNITITLPTSAATLVGTSTTDTLTNKTFGDAVTFDDDISVSGNSNFGGTVTVAGATSLASTLAVGGAATFESTATVSGTAGFLGAVRVSGNASVGGTLDVAGNVSLGGNVTVKGDVHVSSKVCASAFYGDGTNITGIPITGNISVSNANVGGTLFVSSTATIKGATSLASTLDVAGNTSIGGTSNITGKAEFEDDVSVSGNVNIGGTTTIAGNTSIGGTLDVAGNVSLGGNVTVKGDVHVSSKVCASAFFGDGSNLSNITAVVQGNISVSNATIGGNLYVSGTTTVVGATHLQSTVSVNGAANFNSTVTIKGDVSVSGDINVGGHVTIAGAVSLGSTLDVNGNASVGGTFLATGKAEFEDDVSVSGNTVVGGTVSIGGGIIDLKNTGSQSELRMYCESSNAHYAALKAPAHADFSGNIDLVMPASADTLAGIAATQTFTNKTFGDKVEFDNDVCISGNAFIGGTATIAGNVSIGGTSNITGKAEFEDDVSVSGNVVIGGTTTITGAVSLGSTLDVAGNVSVSGDLNIGGHATVAGAMSIGGAVSVGGAVNLLSTATVSGAAGFLGTVRVSGNTSLEGQLQLTKSAAAVVCATAINGVASVSLNFGNAQNFSTTVTAAHTLAKPTGCRTGQTGSIFLTQSGGSGTMAYNADFKFIGGTDPTLSTDNGAVDRLDYIVVSASSDGVGGDIHMIISQAYA